MIQSMTGFGKTTVTLPNKKIIIEIKSLNSKQLDLSTRIAGIYRENELAIRSLIAKRLERGKIDFSLYIENNSKETSSQINQPVLEGYYKQIVETSEKLGIEIPSDWFQILLKLPDALKYETQEPNEDEWNEISKGINEAIDHLEQFRIQEGHMLEKLFYEKIDNIYNLLSNIESYETERIDKIRTRISETLEKIENFTYDKNRFEQEMIFYIEKLDINEEKNRLLNHLKYFKSTAQENKNQGKKLGFITQEIGREINTMGSKSNHAEMQQTVVQMKDELEQIKEQILNVL